MVAENSSASGESSSTKNTARKLDIVVLGRARREGRKELNPGQYEHVRDVIKRLVNFNLPAEISDLRIEPIADFFELKEKGGLLGRINIRIYFAVLQDDRKIIVLKVYRKDEEGQVPRHVVIGVQARMREYLRGESRDDVIYYSANVTL